MVTKNKKKFRLINIADRYNNLCVWVGEIIEGKYGESDAIVRYHNAGYNEVREDFFDNLKNNISHG